jgi:photosystem II stability/assembly factor-like uncharacterized protein
MEISPTITPINTPVPIPSFLDLHMIDANNGWTVRDNHRPLVAGDVLFTTTGGASWKNISPALPTGFYTGPAVNFYNPQVGIAVYVQYLDYGGPPGYFVTWRTADGGQSWQAGAMIKVPDAEAYANQIILSSSQHGYLLTDGSQHQGSSVIDLYDTQDGGIHWNLIYNSLRSVLTGVGPSEEIMDQFIAFSDPHLVFRTATQGFFNSGGLFATQDGGKTWSRVSLPNPPEFPDLDTQLKQMALSETHSTVQFFGQQDGVFVRRIYPSLPIYPFYPDHDLAILPKAEYLYFTHDGGNAWIIQNSPAKIGTIFFLNKTTGWYVGKDDANPTVIPDVYLTQDGGDHWIKLGSKNPPPLGSELQFTDEKHGFANNWIGSYNHAFDPRSGGRPQFYFTKDGGKTWETIEPQVNSTPPTSMNPTPSPQNAGIGCSQKGLSTYCTDKVLGIDFAYPSAWGEITTYLNQGRCGGFLYSYYFNPLNPQYHAGGVSKDYCNPMGGDLFTFFHGFEQGQGCKAFPDPQDCRNINDRVAIASLYPPYQAICAPGPGYIMSPVMVIGISIPGNHPVSGFVFAADFLSDNGKDELYSAFGGSSIDTGKCLDPTTETKYTQSVKDVAAKVKQGTIDAETSQNVTAIRQFAGSIIFTP